MSNAIDVVLVVAASGYSESLNPSQVLTSSRVNAKSRIVISSWVGEVQLDPAKRIHCANESGEGDHHHVVDLNTKVGLNRLNEERRIAVQTQVHIDAVVGPIEALVRNQRHHGVSWDRNYRDGLSRWINMEDLDDVRALTGHLTGPGLCGLSASQTNSRVRANGEHIEGFLWKDALAVDVVRSTNILVPRDGRERITHEFVFVPGCNNSEDEDHRERNGNAPPPRTSLLPSTMGGAFSLGVNLVAKG